MIRRLLPALLAALLVACSGAPAPAPKATPAPARAKAVAKLQRPKAGTATLRGRVTLEAAYALTRGGRLLPRAGKAPEALAMGARPDPATGRLVSDQGGGVVADGGGNVVSTGGNGLLAADLGDGTLVAGGAVVSTGGNGLIGNNGGGVVSTGGNGYMLAQGETPAVGTELPAAGMLVSVVSLADRRYLPLGTDPDGEPVHAVYSNAAGGFEVHVPADAPANLLVVATAPGAADRRLSLNVVVTSRGEEAAVDELGRLVTRYLRRAFTGRLVAALRAPEAAKALAAVEPTLTDRSRADLTKLVDTLQALAQEAGLPADADDARLGRAAQRLVDLGLADLDLAALEIDAADLAIWAGRPPMSVLAGYRTNLGDLLAGAAARLRADPQAFSQAFLADVVNAPDGDRGSPPIGDWAGAIRTPGDVGEFLLVEYLSSLRVNFSAPVTRLYDTLYGALEPEATAAARAAKAEAAVDVVYGAGLQTMAALARRLATEPGLRAQAREILADGAAGAAAP
jgi:hypothetical protein